MENVEKVIKDYQRYLIRVSSTLTKDNEIKEDLIQCGRIAIWKAYNNYNQSQGEFHQYALVCLRGAMMNHLSANGRTIKVPQNKLDKEIKTLSINFKNDEDNEMDVEDLIEDNEDDDTQLHFKVLLRHYLPRMKEQWQKILMMRYTEDMTLEEIGIELGITKEAVRQQHTNAIEYLQKLIKTKGTI